MFDDFDVVALTHGIEKFGLSKGSEGTIVHSYEKGDAYEVDFSTLTGLPADLVTLEPKDIVVVWSKRAGVKVEHITSSKSKTKDEKYQSMHQLISAPRSSALYTSNYQF